MTTKRKTILKAIALHGTATLDDLVYTTVFERKNLHDNIKATMKDGLCERIRDDVTGQPAYKLTPKGRAWLENDQSSSVKPQAQVGENSASNVTGSHVVGGETRADLLPVGNAVKAPPKPEPVVKLNLTTEKPMEVSADEIKDAQRNADLEVRLDSAGRSIVEFCEWLAKKAKVRCPLNLHECKSIVDDAFLSIAGMNGLANRGNSLAKELEKAYNEADERAEEIAALHKRIADLESNAELPLAPPHVSQLGYTVMEFDDDDFKNNIMELPKAREKAAVHSLRTCKKTAVFVIVDRVENVSVEWAA